MGAKTSAVRSLRVPRAGSRGSLKAEFVGRARAPLRAVPTGRVPEESEGRRSLGGDLEVSWKKARKTLRAPIL